MLIRSPRPAQRTSTATGATVSGALLGDEGLHGVGSGRDAAATDAAYDRDAARAAGSSRSPLSAGRGRSSRGGGSPVSWRIFRIFSMPWLERLSRVERGTAEPAVVD
jgi:hypothetical protein